MNRAEQTRALDLAVAAARAAGALMRRHLNAGKKITSATQHDIKLELDVRCQRQIERVLRQAGPQIAVLGEEGIRGQPDADYRWVIDPIDGTVNFTYGIPHACVSIALQGRATPGSSGQRTLASEEQFLSLLGVVYDPFCDEAWTARRGEAARLNGRLIRVSQRRRLAETLVSIGFSKNAAAMKSMLPAFNRLIRRVRKVRMMGAAALGLAYVATGRLDAYVEHRLSLWDIAAGGLIVECAGGEFWRRPTSSNRAYRVIACNGHLRPLLERYMPR